MQDTKNICIHLRGGLGNRMFLLASGYAIAKQQNKRVCVIQDFEDKHNSINYDYNNTIFRNFNFDFTLKSDESFKELHVDCFRKVDIPNKNLNLHIIGYLQCYKYFHDIKNEIYDLFRIENSRKTMLLNKYKNIDLDNKYFIHIRRTDYVNSTIHYVRLDEYLKNCFDLLASDAQFLIFSDDIEYCKNYEVLKGKNVTFIENENAINSLYLMTFCKLGGIMCNSAFSWWGGYLNENPEKKIFIPNCWINTSWITDVAWEGTTVVPCGKIINKQVTLSSNGYTDLKDTTFIIPCGIEQEDRLINLKIQLKYLLDNFNTNIILIESGKDSFYSQMQLTEREISMIDYEFIYSEDEIFHRMKILNMCLKKVKTKVVVNCDVDALIPLDKYLYCQELILDNVYDMIHPFSNPPGVYLINQKDKDKINYKDIKTIQPFCDRTKASNGYLIFFKTSEYIRMGGEDERFVSYSPEDEERVLRAKYHKLRHVYINSEVYHLEHNRGINSCNKNPYFIENEKLFKSLREKYINSV